jgi:4,5-dihydroxyphthalate decarboxylase
MQDMLKTGELDAQILSDSGSDASSIDKVTRRLWPKYREVEADYYKRTSIFPIRHLMVVKDDALRDSPDVAPQLVNVFEAAKQQSYQYWADHRRSSLAWFGAEQEEERALLGADPWPYSVEQNRIVLETLLDYAFEQGLTERRLEIKEIFSTSLPGM